MLGAGVVLFLAGLTAWVSLTGMFDRDPRYEGGTWFDEAGAAYSTEPVLAVWPDKTVTYAMSNCPATLDCGAAQETVRRAMAAWDAASGISLVESGGADILISWQSGQFYADVSFDGPGGVLAYAFPPFDWSTNRGDIIFDDGETWVVGAADADYPRTIDLYTVALHEIGHALGLNHSDDPRALMYAYYVPGRSITPQDLALIQQVYGPPGPVIVQGEPGQGQGAASTGSEAQSVTLDHLNLRNGPSTDNPILTVIPYNTQVTVLGYEGAWAHVIYDGVEGWVYGAYLMTVNP